MTIGSQKLLDEGTPWRAQVVVTRNENHMVIDYSQTINRFTLLDVLDVFLYPELMKRYCPVSHYAQCIWQTALYQFTHERSGVFSENNGRVIMAELIASEKLQKSTTKIWSVFKSPTMMPKVFFPLKNWLYLVTFGGSQTYDSCNPNDTKSLHRVLRRVLFVLLPVDQALFWEDTTPYHNVHLPNLAFENLLMRTDEDTLFEVETHRSYPQSERATGSLACYMVLRSPSTGRKFTITAIEKERLKMTRLSFIVLVLSPTRYPEPPFHLLRV